MHRNSVEVSCDCGVHDFIRYNFVGDIFDIVIIFHLHCTDSDVRLNEELHVMLYMLYALLLLE